jgi:hypothetical protein
VLKLRVTAFCDVSSEGHPEGTLGKLVAELEVQYT